MVALIPRSNASVEFATLPDAELAQWARGRLRELKADADERTLRQTIALVGTSVRRLAAELDKLATAALPLFVWLLGYVYGGATPAPVLAAAIIAGALIILMHHANIGRLLRGEESKFR